MNSLYLENSIIGSLFRFFSPYFSTATRPTRFLLTWLVIAQVALQAFPSLRFLHRNFLSQVTHRCLNSYYRALQNETVTSCSLRLQTSELACILIPAALLFTFGHYVKDLRQSRAILRRGGGLLCLGSMWEQARTQNQPHRRHDGPDDERAAHHR